MREFIDIASKLAEEELNEINLVRDFDDHDDKDADWDNAVRVARLDGADLYCKTHSWGWQYTFVNDWGNPVGRASVSKFQDNFVSVAFVRLKPEVQGQGIGYQFYLYLIEKQHLKVISDRDQTPKGQALWRKLARNGFVRTIDDGNQIGDHVVDIEEYYGWQGAPLVAMAD